MRDAQTSSGLLTSLTQGKRKLVWPLVCDPPEPVPKMAGVITSKVQQRRELCAASSCGGEDFKPYLWMS